jgi:hypothetical protein
MRRVIYLILLICFISIFVYAGSQQASTAIASAIIQRSRAYLNDPTIYGGTQKRIWNDTELLQWLNDGTLDIATRTQCLEDIETETLTANTSTYTLSNNFIAIKSVIYKEAAGSEWTLQKGDLLGLTGTPSFGYQKNMTGAPKYWTQWGNTVIVYPIPDTGAASDTIDVYLVKRPAVVISSAAVLVPAIYERALTLYVTSQALFKDSKFAKARNFMNEYFAELDRYRADYVEPMPKQAK